MSEEYRMEAYKIFELGVMSTRKRIAEFFKDKFNVKRNTSLLEGINVVYIDDTVFSHKQNKQYLLEDMRKQLGQNVIGINLNEYMYITSLSGQKISTIENSRFPDNLYKRLKNIEDKYIVFFFNPEFLGNKKLDQFIRNSKPRTQCLCIHEDREYSLLENAYISSLFPTIKQIYRA